MLILINLGFRVMNVPPDQVPDLLYPLITLIISVAFAVRKGGIAGSHHPRQNDLQRNTGLAGRC